MSNTRRVCGFKALKKVADLLSSSPPSGRLYAYDLALPIIGLILDASQDTLSPDKRVEGRGFSWVQQHIESKHDATVYLRSLPTDYFDVNLHVTRVVELAELLYNLQLVPGITAIYQRFLTDPSQIEATIVELEGLMILWLAKLTFRIHHNGAGENLKYECEATLHDGTTAYCEMKCKVEALEFSESNVRSTLEHARKHQLPKGKCGVILMKIPYQWLDLPETWNALERVIRDVMRKTTRIAEVLCYERPLVLTETHAVRPLSYKEFINENSPYAPLLADGLIGDRIKSGDLSSRWLPFSILTQDTLRKLLEVELINDQNPQKQSEGPCT